MMIAVAAPLTAANHSQTAGSSMLTFDHKTGNEWWVEVVLSGPMASSIVKVEAMDTGGAWVTLTKRSWGAWASSFHIEPGHLVKFRASWSSGVVESCWFTHPAGVEQCGAVQPFAANFGWPSGNNWWIQVKVAANRPLAGVDARVNGGTWNALKFQSWGEWAASFHMPTGSKVQLRARATDGSFDMHYHGYVWPQANPYPTLGGQPQMHFENVKGTAWWQQVNVYGSKDVKGVDVRLNGGEWKPMRQQSYGDWTTSLNAPEGTTVQFRGTMDGGSVLTSGCYRWTAATPVACADSGAWPREGSWVVYSTHSSQGVPGYYRSTDSAINLVYRNGAWSGTCQGTTEEGRENNEGGYDVTYENFTENVNFRPLVQSGAAVGATVDLPFIDRCTVHSEQGEATPDGTHALKNMGRVSTFRVERAAEPAGTDAYQDIWSYADQATGLALFWDHWHLHSRDHGEVTGTDAPLGPALSAAEQHAIQGPWPVEGSYVEQSWCGSDAELGYCTGENFTTQRFEFRGGAWVGVSCVGILNGVEVNQKPTGSRPAFGPTAPNVTATVRVDRPQGCGTTSSEFTVGPTVAVGTNVGGCCPYDDPTFVEAWYGDVSSGTPDHHAVWDVETGLVLDLMLADSIMWTQESDVTLV